MFRLRAWEASFYDHVVNRVFIVRIEVSTVIRKCRATVQSTASRDSRLCIVALSKPYFRTSWGGSIRVFLGASMASIPPPQALERFCVYSLRWVITAVWLVFHSPFSYLPRNLKQTLIHRPLLPFTTINGRLCFSQSPNFSKLTSPQFLNLSPPPTIPSPPPLPHRILYIVL